MLKRIKVEQVSAEMVAATRMSEHKYYFLKGVHASKLKVKNPKEFLLELTWTQVKEKVASEGGNAVAFIQKTPDGKMGERCVYPISFENGPDHQFLWMDRLTFQHISSKVYSREAANARQYEIGRPQARTILKKCKSLSHLVTET
jgi:hypothetical protein